MKKWQLFSWKWLGPILVAIVLVAQIRFIYLQNSWSPIDEYAHMDYIEKLSAGRMPAVSDTIEPEILNDIFQHPERTVAHRPETISSLGLALYSYQAKHPPVYYLLLAPLNSLLKALHYPIFERVRFLRWVSFGGYVLGLFLLIPLTRKFRAVGFRVKPGWPVLGILFGLLVASHERYGLGNNMWSLLMTLLALVFLLQFKLRKRLGFLWMTFFMIGISLVTALTNIFLLPLELILIAWILKRQQLNFFHFVRLSSAWIIPLLCFVVWRMTIKPDPSYSGWIEEILQQGIPAGAVEYTTFLSYFFRDMWTLDFLAPAYYSPWLLGLFFLLTFVWAIWPLGSTGHAWMISAVLSAYVLILLFVLNRYVDSVTWVAFRHYIGLIPVFFLIVSPGIRPSSEENQVNNS